MRRNFISSLLILGAAILLLLALFGCTGRGDVAILQLPEKPMPLTPAGNDQTALRVAVWPPDTWTRPPLWSREHMWSGKSYYTVPGGNVPVAIALTMVKHFREAGWQAWIEAPGGTNEHSDADVTLSSELDELSVEVVSRFGRTHLTVSFGMTVTATNAADQSTVRMRLRGHGTERVFWFEPEDIQKLVGAMMTDTLDKFLAATKVENRALRSR